MAERKQKKEPNQLSLFDYQLKEVRVRLKLENGESLFGDKPLNSPEAAAAALWQYVKEADREHFMVINLDTRCRPLSFNVVSIGTVNACLAEPRETFKSAILSNASGIMLVHNHPSGDPSPSQADNELTRRMAEAGNILGIPVLDHLILGSDEFYSMKTERPEVFAQSSKSPERGSAFRETAETDPAEEAFSKKEQYRNKLAELFLAALKEKGLTWRKGWHSGGALRNGITGRAYRGTNVLTLMLTAQIKGFTDRRWYSFTQISDRDGKYHPGEKWTLKKGSKATYVEYWFCFDRSAKKDEKKWYSFEEAEARIKAGEKTESDFLIKARYYPVFNGSQIEGLTPDRKQGQDSGGDLEEVVEKIRSGMDVAIKEDPAGQNAFYRPLADTIFLPPKGSFVSGAEYNATALHELAHASGHPKRLNRNLSGGFGQESYAREELVAEITSAFLGFHLNCDTSATLPNHQAYINNWIRNIQEKPEALERAIKDAQTAADYMEKAGGLYQASLMEGKEPQYADVPMSIAMGRGR